MAKYLITGASGQIGSYVLERFLDRAEVIGADNFSKNETVDIFKKYSAKSTQIKSERIETKNKGLAYETRNM